MFESLKPIFYCFDQSDVELMNDFQSAKAKHLTIKFDLKAELCALDQNEIECAPTSE